MEKESVCIEKNFVDENGKNATVRIQSVTGYNVNLFSNCKYKLANFRKNNNLLGVNKKNNFLTREIGPKIKGNGLFTRDIGIKSGGFAQVASLSFIIAIGTLFIFYLLFRY